MRVKRNIALLMNKIFLKIGLATTLIVCAIPASSRVTEQISEAPQLITFKKLAFKDSHKKHLLNDRVLAFSDMQNIQLSSGKDGQKWDFRIAGLHPKKCRFALRKLSQYERYKDFLGLVKESKYKEKGHHLSMLLDAKLMPFPMRLSFQLPRIKSPGVYTFGFDRGFLKGLKGEIHVSKHKNRCLFYTTSYWQGAKTSIPNAVFEFFSKTLGKMSMEKLFQISKSY